MEMRGTGWKRRLAVTAAGIVFALGTVMPASAQEATALEQLNEVFHYIDQYHYSGISDTELRDAAIRGMLEALDDPHTQYYDEEEWKALQDSFEQNYVGIGIQFVETEEGLRILTVFEHSAAAEAGLKPGDIIAAVAGKELKQYSFEEVREDLYGPEGTSVTLGVVKAGEQKMREVTITRKPFHIPTVKYGRVEGGAGYIAIQSFSSDTAKLVGDAVASFKKAPEVKALILDLRGNPGGYMDAVAAVAEYFLDAGILLHTANYSGELVTMTIESQEAVHWPLVVLVDEYSASASEILAGALQDHGRATIIGERTFGKGSVQQLVPLQTGGGLRLTVEHYLTPNGSEVNGVGIAPDIAVSSPLAQTITAMREANIKKIRAELLPYETIVNGVSFDFAVPVLREDSGVYVQARSIAEAMNGEAEWQPETSSVIVRGFGRSAAFTASNGLLLKDGVSYIEIREWSEAFPQLKWEAGEKSVVLEMN